MKAISTQKNRWFGLLVVVLPLLVIGATVWVEDSKVPTDFLGSQWMWLSGSLLAFLPIWLMGLFFRPKVMSRLVSEGIEWVLMIGGILQACYGLGQIMGMCTSGHSQFLLTGSFYNPGPYSGYLAAMLPLSVYHYHTTRKLSGCVNRVKYYVALLSLFLIVCVLPAGMSRAAWLAASLSCLYVIGRIYATRLKSFLWKHKCLALTALLLMLLAGVGIYFMKRASADGRLLIWKVCMQLVAEHPLGNHQACTFSSLYGQAQEDYFSDNTYTASDVWVAGTPDFAFNEFVQLAVEQGVGVTFLFVLLLLFLLYAAGKNSHLIGLGGTLVSLMVFASFSYPLHLPGLVSVWVLVGLSLIGEEVVRCNQRGWAVGLVLLVGLYCVKTYRIYSERTTAVREWQSVRFFYQSGSYRSAADNSRKLFDRMKWHKEFCFEYGRSLYLSQCYAEAEQVLQTALDVSGDPMILNLLGRNAQDAGNYEEAEKFLLRAARRVPERIYPHYLLVKLYSNPAFFQKERLITEANFVLFHKEKVSSTAVREMRQDVRKILKETLGIIR